MAEKAARLDRAAAKHNAAYDQLVTLERRCDSTAEFWMLSSSLVGLAVAMGTPETARERPLGRTIDCMGLVTLLICCPKACLLI